MAARKNPRRADGRKPAKPFKKGNTEHTKSKRTTGVPSYDAEELSKRKVDNHMLSRYISLNCHLTKAQLQTRLADPNISILELRIIESMLVDNIAYAFGALIDRVAGQVAQKHEVNSVKSPYDGWSLEQIQTESERLERENRKTMTFIEIQKGIRATIDVTPKAKPSEPDDSSSGGT